MSLDLTCEKSDGHKQFSFLIEKKGCVRCQKRVTGVNANYATRWISKDQRKGQKKKKRRKWNLRAKKKLHLFIVEEGNSGGGEIRAPRSLPLQGFGVMEGCKRYCRELRIKSERRHCQRRFKVLSLKVRNLDLFMVGMHH